MNPREELVDDLDLRALAVLVADPVNLGGDDGEYVFALRVGFGRTRSHHRHRALSGLCRTAGDWCINQEDITLGEALTESLRVIGKHCCACKNNAAGAERGGRTFFAKEHGVRLISIDDENDDYLARRAELCRVCAGNAAFTFE